MTFVYALAIHGQHKLWKYIILHFITLYIYDTKNKEILIHTLNKAKRDHGTIPVRFLKVIVAGSGAAGKTNFINLLMKKEFKEDHHSTNVVHTNHAVSFRMATFQQSSEVDDELVWVELDSELEIDYLQSVLLPKTQELPESSSEVVNKRDTMEASTKGPDKSQSKPPKEQSVFQKWLTKFFVRSTKHSTLPTAGSIVTVDNTDSVNDSNLSTIDSILNSKSSQSGAPIYQPGAVLNIITLLDTGGQPEYIHLLPTINVNPTLTFVVHNLSKSLDDQVLVEYSQHGKHMFKPYHLSYSNMDMIKFLMSTVNDCVERPACNISDLQLAVTPGSDDKSYICIVGTHADKVSQSDKENTGKKLASLVKKTKCHALVWHLENKNVLFSVDNTTAGNKDREDLLANDIRNRIETLASKKEVYELPITWMLLQLEIRQVCSKRGKSYISFSDCVTIAKESGLISNQEEVKGVLQYHHILGVLIYFHEVPGLCDYVVIDHQWWFDKLSSIICITFQDFLNYHAVQKLKYQGLFSKDLVKHVEWKDDIKEEYFFSLLIQMKIIIPVKQDGIEEYFIPFVLSAYDLKCETEILSQYGHLQGEPLLIQFYSGLLPRGLFCSLLVELLQYPLIGSEPHFSHGDTQHAFSNLFTFSLPNAYSMSLLDKLSYLEVQIRHPKKAIDIPVHAKVYNYLMYVLTDVCNHLKFNFQRLQCGFLCKCCSNTEDHIAILPHISSSMLYARCSIESVHHMKLSPSHLIWFSHGKLPQAKRKGK